VRAEIFAYEFALERAWAEHLRQLGLTVHLDFVYNKKKAPYIDRVTYQAEPTGTVIKHDGIDYYFVYRGPLTTRFVANTGPDSAVNLTAMVAAARVEGQLWQRLNEGPYLPDHWINEMIETPANRGHDPEQKYDWFELRHTVTLNIRPLAFTN
jgi:hypothetical protein